MKCWVVIPVKASAQIKSRLARVLDTDERARLAHAMLARVTAAAQHAQNVSEVLILGGRNVAQPGIKLLDDPGRGLNSAAQSALAAAVGAGVGRLIFIHGDLPLVTAQDIELLAGAPDGEVAIAPDRHGIGTNSISLPLPQARDFAFAFGPYSFALHGGEVERLGLKMSFIHSTGLAKDIDEPDDLKDAAELLRPTGQEERCRKVGASV